MKKYLLCLLLFGNAVFASITNARDYQLGGISLGTNPEQACQIMIDKGYAQKLHTSQTNCSDTYAMNSLHFDSGKIDSIRINAMNFGFNFSASTRDIAQELFNSWSWIQEFTAVELNNQLGFTYTEPNDNVKIQVYYRGNQSFPVIELSKQPKRNF